MQARSACLNRDCLLCAGLLTRKRKQTLAPAHEDRQLSASPKLPAVSDCAKLLACKTLLFDWPAPVLTRQHVSWQARAPLFEVATAGGGGSNHKQIGNDALEDWVIRTLPCQMYLHACSITRTS